METGPRVRHGIAVAGALLGITLAPLPCSGQVFAPPVALNTNAATDSGVDRVPRVATDGAGTWVAVWQSSESLGGTIGNDTDILVSRSVDDGVTWSAPAALNSSAATDSRGDESPDVTTDGFGTWVAVWESNESLGSTIGTDDDILVARSIDDGVTWSAVTTVNDAANDSGNDVTPRLATDGTTWVAVWETNDQLGASLGNDRDVATSRSTDGGVTWSTPIAVNTNAAADSKGDFTPRLATDGAGQWVTVWRTQDTLGGAIGGDDDLLFARSSDGGLTWTPPGLLNTNAATDAEDDREVTIATDGGGVWIAAWRSQEDVGSAIGGDDDILFARSTNGGASWTGPAPLNANASVDTRGDFEPSLVSDGPMSWQAVWRSRDTLGDTIGTDDDIVIARSLDGGHTWGLPRPTSDEALTDGSDDLSPMVATNGGGLLLLVWESKNSLDGTINTDADILIQLGSICGDGAVGPGEECDDGNDIDGDCCTTTCEIDLSGSICDDGDPCTQGDGCFGGECAGVPIVCPMCEICKPEAGGCEAAPRDDCALSTTPERGQLQIKNKVKDGGDRLIWKVFKAGEMTDVDLASPEATDDYAFCLYDESAGDPELLFRATAPAGGTCKDNPCWKDVGPIVLYKDPDRTPEGIKGIVARAGEAGRSQISVKGKGESLSNHPFGLPTLPLALPARAQLHIRNGGCWEARYTEDGVKRNDETKFKAFGTE